MSEQGIPIITGTRVRVRHKHAYGEGPGRWGLVRERRGKSILVLFDGEKRARQEHVAHVVERRAAALLASTAEDSKR